MIHDLHQHVWPRGVVEVLRARREPPRLEGDVLVTREGSFPVDVDAALPERRAELLERRGIDVALVSLQPTLEPTEDIVAAYHEGISNGDPRLRPLACGRALEGFAGATVAARDLLDLDSLAPLLDELQSRSLLLFVHPGPGVRVAGGPDWWCSVVDYTAQMQAAYAGWLWHGVERWPTLRVLFALLAGGAPFQLERLAGRGLELRDAVVGDVYLDTSSYGPRALEFCLSVYGVERLVHGSDSPVRDPDESLRVIRGFGENIAALLLTDNPERLLA